MPKFVLIWKHFFSPIKTVSAVLIFYKGIEGPANNQRTDLRRDTVICFGFINFTFSDASQIRFQLSFTVRDTIVDYINVTCWGQEQFVHRLENMFHAGDISKCPRGEGGGEKWLVP